MDGNNKRERRSIDAGEIRPSRLYRLLTASIVPRPIAWVSSTSVDGINNLAPYSFFTVASSSPAIVSVTSITRKDTWSNVRETGEFVVNIGSESLIDKINQSSGTYPPDHDEFEAVSLTPQASDFVTPPRVAEASIAIECTLHDILEIGNGSLLLGDVVGFSIDQAVLAEDELPDIARLRPPSRLGRDEWGLTPETVKRDRPVV